MWYVHVSTGSQKRVLDLLEPELQVVVTGPDMSTWNKNAGPLQAQSQLSNP